MAEKLRPPLATLMGNVGFSALQSRALALAAAQFPWLRTAHITGDGMLEGTSALEDEVRAEEFHAAGIALLAHLLGLLESFIGEHLTMQLVREVWPQLPLGDADFDTGEA